MLKLFILFLTSSFAYCETRILGGIYSTQANTGIARTADATSPILNPAGLGEITKSSISSGASSFSAKKTKLESSVEYNTSSNHVSYIKRMEEFNLGFMIVNEDSKFINKINTTNSRNSEELPTGSSESETEKLQMNQYIMAISPRESWWGAAFNLMSINSTHITTKYNQNFSNNSPAQREYSNSTSSSSLNLLLYGISFGFKYDYEAFIFGARIESPRYIFKNDSRINISSINVNGIDSSNVAISHLNYESKINEKESKFAEAKLSLGAAWQNDRWQSEFNINITPAYQATRFELKDAIKAGSFDSSTNTFSETSQNLNGGGNDYSKSSISPSVGIQYLYSSFTTLGAGVSYLPTISKRDEDVNETSFTGGITQRHQNYIGTFALFYVNAQDAGGNKTWNSETQKDEKVDLGYSEVGLSFSGSYFF
tara:strand:- start:6254 stop:7534 length:1281 start_codon:yes stop_codon:yes gene_type:complete